MVFEFGIGVILMLSNRGELAMGGSRLPSLCSTLTVERSSGVCVVADWWSSAMAMRLHEQHQWALYFFTLSKPFLQVFDVFESLPSSFDSEVTLSPYPRGYSREVRYFPESVKFLRCHVFSISRVVTGASGSHSPITFGDDTSRIPSPAPHSLEYSCQGSEESSLSAMRVAPRELLARVTLYVCRKGVNPYASKRGYFSRPETTTLCVVDAVDTLGPLHGRGEVMPSEPSNNESTLKVFHAPRRCMTKGRRLQLPSGAFARGGRGRREAGGRGRPDSPDRVRVSTRDLEDRDRRSFHEAEDRPPKPPSTELTRGKGVANDYPRRVEETPAHLVLLISKIPSWPGVDRPFGRLWPVVLARP
ncbi:hypothetical protein Dimus_024487 [Dionaea muscipula]